MCAVHTCCVCMQRLGNKPVQCFFPCSSHKVRRHWRPEDPLTAGMAMQSLEFDLLVFGLALVHCFLMILPCLPFGMVMFILCHCMLAVYDLVFWF